MFGMMQNPANAYARVSLESAVMTADPHGLILLLFEGAAAAMAQARIHMEQNDIAQRGASISKAIDIVNNGLKAGLNREAGGELAERLAALYDYIVRRLLWANLKNDRAALDEAARLLGEIHSAWAEIAPSKTGPAAP